MTTPVAAVLRVPIDRVRPATNARGQVGDVTELAISIKAIGLQEPLLVFDVGEGWFDIFDGHRRHAACKQAGLSTVDVIPRRDPGQVLRIQHQLAIHAQAKGFDPMAEAEALDELVHQHMLRPDLIARAIGKSPAWVTGRLGLLNLEPAERDQVRDGRLSLALAGAIVAQRRAARDGRTGPGWTPTTPAIAAPRPQQPARHCTTCTCHGRTR